MNKLDWLHTQKMSVSEPWSGGDSSIFLLNKNGKGYSVITDDVLHFIVKINKSIFILNIHQIKDVFFFEPTILHYRDDKAEPIPCPFCERTIDFSSKGSHCPFLSTHTREFIDHFKNKSSYRLRFFSHGIHEILSPDEAFKKLDFDYNEEKGEWAWK